jgi:acetylornithine/succinyldiaminopimelate/putrescine aminotransferase
LKLFIAGRHSSKRILPEYKEGGIELATQKTDWIEMDKKYHMNTFRRVPVVFERGEGVYLYDVNGKKYLDFFAGFAVDCLGHAHPVRSTSLPNCSSRTAP